ncbi:MAG: 2Fe-2S iron-sulfur cluster-binding protein [Bacillota bacterium]
MSLKITVIIDGQEIKTHAGEKLLWAALDNGIYIPHLCAVKDEKRPNAGCRLCFVELEGHRDPVTACTQAAADGMIVQTRSPRVDRLVRTAFELLLSDHRLKCAACPANKACGLQQIARERGLKLRYGRFKHLEREFEIDESTATFAFDRSRCVLCGRCVWEDRQVAQIGAIGFAGRGMQRGISTHENVPLADSPCNECGLCVKACPVGALYFK